MDDRNRVMAFMTLHSICGPMVKVEMDKAADATIASCQVCGAVLRVDHLEDPQQVDFFVEVFDEIEKFGLTEAEKAIIRGDKSDPEAIAAVYRSHPQLLAFMERLASQNDGDENPS